MQECPNIDAFSRLDPCDVAIVSPPAHPFRLRGNWLKQVHRAPELTQQGFIKRTPRGRILTSHAFRHLGLPELRRDVAQFGLFGDDPEETGS